MNSKTAKLIARVARGNQRRKQAIIARWKAASPKERGRLRAELERLAPRRGTNPVRVIPPAGG